MSKLTEKESALALQFLPGFSTKIINDLHARHGSFAAVVPLTPEQLPLACRAGLGEFRENPTALLHKIEATLSYCAAEHVDVLTLGDAAYPALLREISTPPPVLFVRGRVDALSLPQIAIVGSRQSSSGGDRTAASFAAGLAGHGFAITSGLASGIDSAAHGGALRGGVTIAVVATGIDRVYPRQHAELQAKIIESGGAIVSEFPLGTPPRGSHFPQRNRIISGLSLGTLVVEAALRSGSLITARYAMEQGREVFAIPGSIHNPMARGCHQLLRDGATLVETADDIVAQLEGMLAYKIEELQVAHGTGGSGIRPVVSPEQEMILAEMGFDPMALDALVESTGADPAHLTRIMVELELGGLVENQGGIFTRLK